MYVKSTQTLRGTTEQGSQTTIKTHCSVGTMTDPVQTKLIIPSVSPAKGGICKEPIGTPDTLSRSDLESLHSEWQPTFDDIDGEESDDDMHIDENEDVAGDETAEFRETDIDITEGTDGPIAERKYVVFESSLRVLLSVCRFCSRPCNVILKRICGSGAIFECCCLKGHLFKWESQPFHCKMPLGNLLVSSGILFTGSSPKAVINLLEQCNIACMSDRTYRNIQSSYLIPAINNVWEANQTIELQMCQGGGVKVGGDARFCSPGHSAKYASYSMMNMETGVILATELVQVTEVKNSCHMELEGLKKCLSTLKEAGVTITDLITDRHSMVKSFMRKEKPEIRHWFDVWHVAKGVFKKLLAASKKKDCTEIADWAHSISNHMYWAASSSDGNGDMVVQKWESILNHVCNIHEGHGDLFPTCQHEQITRDVCWLKLGSKVHKELRDVITSKFLLKDIRQLSPGEQTSDLEAFHSLVCQFVPKSTHYFYDAMKARLLVAALHSNENAQRSQAVKKDGTARFKISYPKAKKGDHCVKVVKEGCTYDYVIDLMEEAFDLRQEYCSYTAARKGMPAVQNPPPLTSQANRVKLQDALMNYKTRFNKSH